MPKVEFLFDFGSPNAYLAHQVVPGIERRTGVRFEYTPVLLGGVFKATGNKSPMEAYGHIANKIAYDQLETRRFVARHHLDRYKFNPFFPVNTLAIMRGAVAAELRDELPAYAETVFRGMWEEGKKMDDPAVIRSVLVEAGLDGDALIAATQTAEVKDRLIKNTETAVARGVFGIPTFFVNGEIYFGKDKLDEIERAIGR